MSIQRYSLLLPAPDECGGWVKHKDHLAEIAAKDRRIAELEAELAKLKEAQK